MISDDQFNNIVYFVHNEVSRQNKKWGDQRDKNPHTWMVVLMEEIGEVAKSCLEGNVDEYIPELVQSAAVIFQMIYSSIDWDKENKG
jgi:hypothetical protein